MKTTHALLFGLLLALTAAPALAKDGPNCKTNDTCEEGAYCAKPAGQCNREGTCEPRPQICTREFAPVCGCDGMTYSNACVAASQGVNVASEGECEEKEKKCGANAACPEDQYCAKPEGQCTGQGVCAARPQICTREFDPVCGCDDTTDPNACTAAGAGENVKSAGECPEA